MGGRESSPSRMTDPLPNCLSICDRASSKALLRSPLADDEEPLRGAAMVVPFVEASPAITVLVYAVDPLSEAYSVKLCSTTGICEQFSSSVENLPTFHCFHRINGTDVRRTSTRH